MGSMASGGLSAAGGAVKAVSAFSAGIAERDAHQVQAGIARDNAAIAERNANIIMAAGEGKAEAFGMRNKAQAGTIKAKQAASGVALDSGSSADVRTSQRVLGLFDTMAIKSNAAREAFGYKVKASDLRNQATLEDTEARNAKRAGVFNAFGSLLGAASSAAGSFAQWSDVGAGAAAPVGAAGSRAAEAMLAF